MPDALLGPTLTIDLAAIAANYRVLRSRFAGKECASVVKANAYGLGVTPVAKTLAAEGCNTFFVATLGEAVELRGVLPEARIFAFHGPYEGEEKDYAAHRILPVINSVAQWKRWKDRGAYALHIDTGMNRLGLTQAELEEHHLLLATYNLQLLMSHLACAGEPEHEKNTEQLARFKQARGLLPKIPASLCNSSGIFLEKDFHFDLARPGCALYGINPVHGKNPVRPVVTLAAPILQIRTTDREDTVGYGATFQIKKGDRLAIVQLGYADGYSRILSSKGTVYIDGHTAQVAGRVSMDMIAVDLRDVPEAAYDAGRVEVMNEAQTVNDIARACATIGYEILTGLGARVQREYR